MHEAVLCVYVSLTKKDLTFLSVTESRMNVCVQKRIQREENARENIFGKTYSWKKEETMN